ncbi:hypothetical protein QAD02_006762 [Eretmocerus hayati]|uniref:Uncharacterized protein n=1 Tax=Eretmocerus hayati TaxID=131215 RepID=A0ACC2N625_9HYME|nr:hypothetical protein QAD02_006762 [Eretmocerus hayati]
MEIKTVGKRLIIDGYVYKKCSQDLNRGRINWECVRYRDPYLNCRARAITYISSSGENIRVHQGPKESNHDHQPSHKEVRRAERIARRDSLKEVMHSVTHPAPVEKVNRNTAEKEKHEVQSGSTCQTVDKDPSTSDLLNSTDSGWVVSEETTRRIEKIDEHQSQKDEKIEKTKEHQLEKQSKKDDGIKKCQSSSETKKTHSTSTSKVSDEIKTESKPKIDHDQRWGRTSLIRDPTYYRRFLLKFLESLVFTRQNIMETLKVVYKSPHSRTVACSIIFEHQEKVVEDLMTLLNDPKTPITAIDDCSISISQHLSSSSLDTGKLELLKSCAEKIAKLENRKLQLQKICCSIEGTQKVEATEEGKASVSTSSDRKITSEKTSILCIDLTDELDDKPKIKKEVPLIDLDEIPSATNTDTANQMPIHNDLRRKMDDNNNTSSAQPVEASSDISTGSNSSLSDLLKLIPCESGIQYPNMHYPALPLHMATGIPWMPMTGIPPFHYVDPNYAINFPTMMSNEQLPIQNFGPMNSMPAMNPIGHAYQQMGSMYPTNSESFISSGHHVVEQNQPINVQLGF